MSVAELLGYVNRGHPNLPSGAERASVSCCCCVGEVGKDYDNKLTIAALHGCGPSLNSLLGGAPLTNKAIAYVVLANEDENRGLYV